MIDTNRKTKIIKVKARHLFISNPSQRDYRPAWAQALSRGFNIDYFGLLKVSMRNGQRVAILDGQHRFEAFKLAHGEGWEDVELECEAFTGLSLDDEAELFLRFNDVLTVTTYDKFMVGVTAGRHDVVDIKNIVEAQGLRVSKSHTENSVGAVGALTWAYAKTSGPTLARALRIIRDAFGVDGMETNVIRGMAMVLHRYGRRIDEAKATRKLEKLARGASALKAQAERARQVYATTQIVAMAVAITDALNGRGGLGLGNWWKTDDEPEQAAPTKAAPRPPRKAAAAEARATH